MGNKLPKILQASQATVVPQKPRVNKVCYGVDGECSLPNNILMTKFEERAKAIHERRRSGSPRLLEPWRCPACASEFESAVHVIVERGTTRRLVTEDTIPVESTGGAVIGLFAVGGLLLSFFVLRRCFKQHRAQQVPEFDV